MPAARAYAWMPRSAELPRDPSLQPLASVQFPARQAFAYPAREFMESVVLCCRTSLRPAARHSAHAHSPQPLEQSNSPELQAKKLMLSVIRYFALASDVTWSTHVRDKLLQHLKVNACCPVSTCKLATESSAYPAPHGNGYVDRSHMEPRYNDRRYNDHRYNDQRYNSDARYVMGRPLHLASRGHPDGSALAGRGASTRRSSQGTHIHQSAFERDWAPSGRGSQSSTTPMRNSRGMSPYDDVWLMDLCWQLVDHATNTGLPLVRHFCRTGQYHAACASHDVIRALCLNLALMQLVKNLGCAILRVSALALGLEQSSLVGVLFIVSSSLVALLHYFNACEERFINFLGGMVEGVNCFGHDSSTCCAYGGF